MGVALTIPFFAQADKVIAYVVLLAFIALYAYGIFIGIKLSEGPPPLKHLRLYFGLQIPFISSPVIAYRFCSGLQATVAMIQSSLKWDFRLGVEGQFAILSSAPWGCGVNFVALAIVFLLYPRLGVAPEDAGDSSAEGEIKVT